MKWSPDVYLEYADHRLRPGFELMARIPHREPRSVLDLGCGTGHLTIELARRFPKANVVGLDASPDMLEQACLLDPRIEWVLADLESWEPSDTFDVIYSNAALHWIDHHEHLIPRLASWTATGGSLAVQVPDNWSARTHTIPARILDGPGWPQTARDALMRDRVGTPGFYRSLLLGGYDSIDIWTTTYHQELSGSDAVLRWVSGSVLRPVLEALDEDDRSRFLELCAEEYGRSYPPEPDGTTMLAFKRLFIVASGARPPS